MLNSLIKKFYTRKPADQKNSIIFSVDDDGRIHLDLAINNMSEYQSEKFGFLLHLINESFYLQSMIDAVYRLSEKNPKYHRFVESTLKSWNSHASKSDEHVTNMSLPIIQPSKFGKS